MHDPEKSKYPFASLTEAVSRIVKIKQYEKENLLEYSKRFKQAKDIIKSHIGDAVLHQFIENLPEYQNNTDTDERRKMKEQSFNKWMAYLIIKNSDQQKYGTLINGLASQYSMKNDQYPVTVTDAIDILQNHKHDNAGKSKDGIIYIVSDK